MGFRRTLLHESLKPRRRWGLQTVRTPATVGTVRLVIARCSVDYAGRLSAHLPLATRLLVVKGDGSVLVHSDSLSYKPLNWFISLSALLPSDIS